MSRKHRNASIDDYTLDQLVDMAVESVGGDPTNSDFTPALERARDKWEDAVERELTKWVSKNIDKFDLDSRPFYNLGDDADVDDIVEVLLELSGGAGYLYFMEMEGHGVGTWDGDWDELFVDGGRGVKELSNHMERVVSREYRDLKNEIENIAFASVPEDEDGYEDDRYSRNRYANRRSIKHTSKSTMTPRSMTASDRRRLIKLASTMPVGSPERKAILAGLSSMQEMLEEEGMMGKMSRKPWGSLGISPTDDQPWGSRDSETKEYRELYNEAYYDAVTSKKAQKSRRRSRRASVAEYMKHDKQTAKMMKEIIDRAVRDWEKAISTLYLDDLSKAYNQIDDFESIANKMKERLGDLFVSHVDGHGMADFYNEVEDEGHYDLIEAYESAKHELQEMVDDGMADEGNERYVQRRIEEDVLPVLEDAIDYFGNNYDPIEAVRKIKYR